MKIKLDKKKKYLLACSFGVDSMALFDILQNNGYSFAVAYVNYGVRQESGDEEKQIIKYAKQNNIKIFNTKAPKFEKGNFQARAREFRYKYFLSLKKEYNFDVVLTAHHKDDYIENYLMQKATNRINFHYGVPETSLIYDVKVQRPLLNYYKSELINHCLENNIPFSNDKTNYESHYLRNSIRNGELKNLSISEKDTIIDEIEKLNKRSNILKKQVITFLQGKTSFEIKRFKNIEQTLQKATIYYLFDYFDIGQYYTKNIFNNIIGFISSRQTSAVLKLKNQVNIYLYDNEVRFISERDLLPYSYRVESKSILKASFFTFNTLKDTEKFNIKEDDYPLTLRPANKGDVYCIGNNIKKLNRVFIDMKMPPYFRKIWPVVVNNNGQVIYIPRYRKDYEVNNESLFTIDLP